jgi:hypothetical protein
MLMTCKLFNPYYALTAKFLEPSTAEKYNTHKIKVRVIGLLALDYFISLCLFRNKPEIGGI